MQTSSYKSRTYTPTRDHSASKSTFYSYSRPYTNTAPNSETKCINLTRVSSPLNPSLNSTSTISSAQIAKENKLKDIQQRYENEAQDVVRKYEQHYMSHMTLGNSVVGLEGALEVEKQKMQSLQDRLNEAWRAIDQEKREKLKTAQENTELRSQIRRKDTLIEDYEKKLSVLHESSTSVKYENDSLRVELKRLNDAYNAKLKEIEEKYTVEVKGFNGKVETMKSQFKEYEIGNEGKIRDVVRELEAKIRNYENQIREKDRIIAESEAGLKSCKEYNMKLKMEYEEELRRQINKIKDTDNLKNEPVKKQLETKVKKLETEEELLNKKITELNLHLENQEKQMKEGKVQNEDYFIMLKRENIGLKDQISLNGTEIERLQGELRGKDSTIARLHQEIANLDHEIKRQKEITTQENSRMYNQNESNMRKFQEYELQLQKRITDLENVLRASEDDRIKLKTDLERFRDMVTGNVKQTIDITFGDFGLHETPASEMYSKIIF